MSSMEGTCRLGPRARRRGPSRSVANPPLAPDPPSIYLRLSPAKVPRTRSARMGVFDFVKNGVREMMIARPDNQKSLIVYKHPDQNFPMYSQLTVDSDECCVFFKDGRVVGVLPPG